MTAVFDGEGIELVAQRTSVLAEEAIITKQMIREAFEYYHPGWMPPWDITMTWLKNHLTPAEIEKLALEKLTREQICHLIVGAIGLDGIHDLFNDKCVGDEPVNRVNSYAGHESIFELGGKLNCINITGFLGRGQVESLVKVLLRFIKSGVKE